MVIFSTKSASYRHVLPWACDNKSTRSRHKLGGTPCMLFLAARVCSHNGKYELSSVDIFEFVFRLKLCLRNAKHNHCFLRINVHVHFLQDNILRWLTGTFFLWLISALYIDNVLPDTNGVRKPWLYFLQRTYWTWKSDETTEGAPSFL